MTTQLVLMNGEPDRPSATGRLDTHTKQLGRKGVLQAREALTKARQRASERDAQRLAERDDELARRAEAARRSAARRSDASTPAGPSTAAA